MNLQKTKKRKTSPKMTDFIITTYKKFLTSIINNGYVFHTFEEFVSNPKFKKILILRHDVDRSPQNALKMAELEHNLGIKATYYF